MLSLNKYLETFSLEEILELNDLTEEDALVFMVEQEFLQLPNPRPCDYDPSEE